MPRPVTPVYSQLSAILQIALHRALTRQQEPRAALQDAAGAMRALLAQREARHLGHDADDRSRGTRPATREARLAWTLALPALGDHRAGRALCRSPGRSGSRCTSTICGCRGSAGRSSARPTTSRRCGDPRFWSALGAHGRLRGCDASSLELAAGLVLALALDRVTRARGLVRTAVLLPWAIPTVVAALIWRFMFESQAGWRRRSLADPVRRPTWFADPIAAWVPLVLADVWKTTPFVALLLLAGLQSIDRSLYEAARGRRRAALAAVIAHHAAAAEAGAAGGRALPPLDAFRVFDLVYVMTGGGPGTATEPIALYTFATLLQNLRFGFGSRCR